MLSLHDVTQAYGSIRALDGVSLEVGEGELLALLGPSGCGKTTALRVAAGFERPEAGRVELAGRTVTGPGVHVAPERRRLGMIFQQHALFPHLDVAGNVGFGLTGRGRRHAAARAGRVREVLELVGLAGLEDRPAGALSGGQQQRVALARALAPEPEVVLLDEPFNAIDPLHRAEMRAELVSVLRRTGVTVLLVTHDREEAFTLADRIALMRDGRIVQVDRPERLYFAPADRWCARFVGAANIVDGASLGLTTAGEVLLRPELVGLEPDAAGRAEVVERVFLGHDVAYRIRLADGTTIESQRPSNEVVELGARVRIRVHEGPVPTVRA